MDVSQYLEIFIDETEEHLQTLSGCISDHGEHDGTADER